MAADNVVAGRVLVHHLKEYLLDTRALFIDGIVKRIDQMIHALQDLFLVHHLRRSHIITCQFCTIIRQPFELDALRMRDEQQIHRLMHRLQLHLLAIVREHKTIILRNQQSAQFPLRSLDTQLLKQGHTNCVQQQVLSPRCMQLLYQALDLTSHFLWCLLLLNHQLSDLSPHYPAIFSTCSPSWVSLPPQAPFPVPAQESRLAPALA